MRRRANQTWEMYDYICIFLHANKGLVHGRLSNSCSNFMSRAPHMRGQQWPWIGCKVCWVVSRCRKRHGPTLIILCYPMLLSRTSKSSFFFWTSRTWNESSWPSPAQLRTTTGGYGRSNTKITLFRHDWFGCLETDLISFAHRRKWNHLLLEL